MRLRVLIVEDNPRMRSLIRSLLGDLASDVSECADAESAVASCRRLAPDVVLMDIALGVGADGIAATRTIRAAHPGTRVVVVSERSSAPYREAALAAGACGFVGKDALLELPALLATFLPGHSGQLT